MQRGASEWPWREASQVKSAGAPAGRAEHRAGAAAIGGIAHTGRQAAEAIRAHPLLTRWLLAGPVALAAGVMTMMAMPIWLPAGAAGVTNIALPIILAPLLWAVPFFYACLEEDLVRGTTILGAAVLLQGLMVAVAV